MAVLIYFVFHTDNEYLSLSMMIVRHNKYGNAIVKNSVMSS